MIGNERLIYKSDGKRQGQLYPYEFQAHAGKKWKGWIIMLRTTFRQFNNEVSPAARPLLSSPGIRPGFQEMLR